jgi:VanZ family protein
MTRDGDARAAWLRVAVAGGVVVLAALAPAPTHDPPRRPPYHLDKFAHAAGHAALAAALADAFEATGTPAPLLSSALCSAGSGVVLELLQRWVPGRRFERGDVAAGALGGVVGGGLGWFRLRRQ